MPPTKQITSLEMPHVERVLEMEAGYVLNFSDRSFANFFAEEIGIDINEQRYLAQGTSKAKRLRCFLNTASPIDASRALRRLLEYREVLSAGSQQAEESAQSVAKIQAIIGRLETSAPNTDGIERFSTDTTLDELVASIQRDIASHKHNVALDRLHTYCMKKFAHLLERRGEKAGPNETLNSRAGRYFNPLRRTGKVRPISEKVMKSTVEIFELFNHIRNNESLAHDNLLVDQAEARYIFDAVLNLLRFLKTVEGLRFEENSP